MPATIWIRWQGKPAQYELKKIEKIKDKLPKKGFAAFPARPRPFSPDAGFGFKSGKQEIFNFYISVCVVCFITFSSSLGITQFVKMRMMKKIGKRLNMLHTFPCTKSGFTSFKK